MSIEIQAPVEVKTKKASLIAKYSRFMAFGYWFINNNSELLTEEQRKELYQKLTIFAPVEEQTEFYQGFEGELTTLNKAIRSMVTEHKKASKPSRAKKSKEPKEPKEPKGEKKSRSKKSKGSQENGEQMEVEGSEPKVEKKSRAKKANKDVVENTDEENSEPIKKPRASRAKKSKASEEQPSERENQTGSVTEVISELITELNVEKKPKASRAKKSKDETEIVSDAEQKPKKSKKSKSENVENIENTEN